MKKMRVLVGTRFLNEGGVGRQIQYLAHHLDHRRFELHLVVLSGKDLFFHDVMAHPGVRARTLGSDSGVTPGTWVKLVRVLRSVRPHILHLFGGTANQLGGLARILVPGPKVIYSVRSANNRTANHLAYRLLRPFQSLVIVNSEGSRRELVERSGYDEDGVRVLPNLLDTERFRPFDEGERAEARRHLGIAPGTLAIGCIGRLSAQKNQMTLLRALVRLRGESGLPRNLRVLLVGRPYADDPGYGAEVQEFRRAAGLEPWVEFRDPVRGAPALFNALDGVIQPSTYEGLSNVAVEAQACGTPLALSSEGDNDRIVEDGRTGISFSAEREREVARAIERLIALSNDPERRLAVTGRARAEVVRRFSVEDHLRSLEEVYREVGS